MSATPRLVLHPGFPKCATSSIQQGFVAQNHALAREIGVRFLGRNFLPDNGYPEVIRLMDAPESCAEEVMATSYNPEERYFLSNEALGGNKPFLGVLQSRFRIESAVFTIRLPALQAISNYRYSGWVAFSFATAAARRGSGLLLSQERMKAKIRLFEDMKIPVRLCPLENPGSTLAHFCQTAFGTQIDAGGARPERQANQSIGLAFADALHHELKNLSAASVSTELKRRLVKAAQAHKMEQDLNRLICSDAARMISEIQENVCRDYAGLLAAYGVPPDEVDRVAEAATRDLAQLARSPVATPAETHLLRAHARTVIAHARDQI